jgi:hypothetical protein
MTLFYITVLIICVYYLKPSLFFDKDGGVRQYGFNSTQDGNQKTIFTFHLFILISSVLIYQFLNCN